MVVQGRLANGAPVDIRLTPHVLERYAERVKPHLTAEEVAEELARLVALCPVREGSPGWLVSLQSPFFHLDLGTVTIPIDPDPRCADRLLARTVLCCGGDARRQRRFRRAQRTARLGADAARA